MNTSAIVLLLALGLSTCRAGTTLQELRKALNTEQRIWILQRSFENEGTNGKHSCVYAHKKHLGEYDYQFDQYYKDGSIRKRHHLYGRLSERNSNAVLTVSRTQGDEGIPYTLTYWDSNQHCGILTFTDKYGRQQCELHAWESSIPPSVLPFPCEQEYQKYCGNHHKYPVYSVACRS
uniref:Putative lipocalin-3 1 n=1 Tax=Amblyomma triste TaxID=251400 RepID=A0A023GDB8_AMBTT